MVIVGYEPDGDSVRFIADDVTHYQALKRADRIRPSKRDGNVQLRFEGVDTPELHYGADAQPLGDTARDARLLSEGQAYYTVYTSSPVSHRSHLRSVAGRARTSGLGVWGRDLGDWLLASSATPTRDENDRVLLRDTTEVLSAT